VGVHRKESTIGVISFVQQLGAVLGYDVTTEEPMFPGDPSSSVLDVTWRRDEHARFPLFIFEVESSPTKAASDNVVKVFSRKTPAFQKPLFFYHIFVERPTDTERINYLRENYDKLKYGAYDLSEESAAFRLISEILDQHFQIMASLDLYSLVSLLETQNALDVTSHQVLDKLLDLEYDRLEQANFLMTLEALIAAENYPSIRQFYVRYLPRYLSYESRPHPKYYYTTPVGYSRVIHFALLLLLDEDPDYEVSFGQLQELEQSYTPWPLWEPYFGLSYDHDMMLLSEFPLILTMLCAAFSPSLYAPYFSDKLKNILVQTRDFTHFTIHGLLWHLLASRIAKDREGYEFARLRMNDNEGIPLDLVIEPTLFVGEEPDERFSDLGIPERVPEYDDWEEWLGEHISNARVDILISVIEGFLLMNHPEMGRASFATFCLQKSLEDVRASEGGLR
jgi:hypothetical protein